MTTIAGATNGAVGAVYASHCELQAMEQFKSALDQPFVKAGALMADAHAGYSLPIGGVMLTEGYVVPAWIGFDIGCGMSAIRTLYSRKQVQEVRAAVFDAIYEAVPVGFAKRDKPVGTANIMTCPKTREAEEIFNQKKGALQLGTLGGGNHFIELGYDQDDDVWVIVHSGSRGVGHAIASYYMAAAAGSDRAEEGHHAIRASDPLGRAYLMDVNFAQEFALDNRYQILREVTNVLAGLLHSQESAPLWGTLINKNHNFIEQGINRKEGQFLHRKGATSAKRGELGIIPGNMRDGSFVVKGKGDGMALWSASHGAGRVMSRGRAKRELSVDDFKAQMEGIKAKVGESTLDEAPGAYKDIFQVMDDQKHLVEIVTHIKPILNIKA